MKSLSKSAIETFNKLAAMAENDEGSFKLNNSSCYMPLSIEKVEDNIISLAHYGEQNGDLIADPEMTFLIKDGSVFPMTFRNDYVGVNWEHIWIEEDGTIKFEKNGLDGAIEFSEIWLNNIKEQQNL